MKVRVKVRVRMRVRVRIRVEGEDEDGPGQDELILLEVGDDGVVSGAVDARWSSPRGRRGRRRRVVFCRSIRSFGAEGGAAAHRVRVFC